MENSPFENITISEICAFSDVSRGTFYNNFSSKKDILSSISRKVISEKLDQFVPTNKDWMVDIVYLFFETSKEKKDYLALLMKQNLFYLHRNELASLFYQHDVVVNDKLYLNLPLNVRPYIVTAYVSSAISIYIQWAQNGFQESTAEITKIFLDIVHHPDELG